MNITRRRALQLTAAGTVAAFIPQSSLFAATPGFISARPTKRNFTSTAIEDKIAEMKRFLGPDSELAWMFENCFPNTLDTTVRQTYINGKPDTFVITGDIPAMWLRDSSAQVWPYLPFAKTDVKLRSLLAGVIRRQTRCILIDPYANAFNAAHEGSEFANDHTAMKPELHERKWEIDSLCYPVRLAHGYWKATDSTDAFNDDWRKAMRLIVSTFREQQRLFAPGPYKFQRQTYTPNDTLNLNGYGNPIRPCGLIASGFRPSDDACIYPFLIPSNFFAAKSLRDMAELATAINDSELNTLATNLAVEVEHALAKYATGLHPTRGKIFAFEVDGFGNQLFMDDANVPSLLSLPYLGAIAPTDPTYLNTRKMILTGDNPYYYLGKAAQGIGGPHVGVNMIWPLAIIMRGLTSTDDREISDCLKTLIRTHAGTGFMHESFDKDEPTRFTRAWFAWANTLFGEFVLQLYAIKPELLKSLAG
jgi:meiotically up-regulated gene 157 (Mug157) protein